MYYVTNTPCDEKGSRERYEHCDSLQGRVYKVDVDLLGKITPASHISQTTFVHPNSPKCVGAWLDYEPATSLFPPPIFIEKSLILWLCGANDWLIKTEVS